MSEPQRHVLEIDRERTAKTFFWCQTLLLTVMGAFIFVIGAILGLIYALTLGKWLPRKQAYAMKYWIEGTTLRVDGGVFWLSRKSIPLDRITDLALVQGPVLRRFGLWIMRVQTAGTGGPRAEAWLIGLNDPEGARDLILKLRDEAVKPPRSE